MHPFGTMLIMFRAEGGGGSDGVVAGVAALDDDALVARFRELTAEICGAEAALAAVIGVVERRQLHRADGHASMHGWLRATGNWGPNEIRQRVRTARLVIEAPRVADAMVA